MPTRTPASRSCGHRCRRFLVVGDAFLFITCCWQSSDRTSRYGRHPQWGDQLAALFAIERRNSELAKQAEPGYLAEVYRKIAAQYLAQAADLLKWAERPEAKP